MVKKTTDSLIALNSFPHQWLCFWLGFVPFTVAGAAFFQPFDRWTFSKMLMGCFFGMTAFGIPAGLISTFIGYFAEDSLRQLQIPESSKALLLAFLIPMLMIGGVGAILSQFVLSGKGALPLKFVQFGLPAGAVAVVIVWLANILLIPIREWFQHEPPETGKI